ncbi:FecR family protein [Pseudoxanthomonas putridarboris]|uniref:FecR domain-containing protein n=1 Tax=Pseudoxanthomonas putridarboris TaxID=752605 RepID=A0ABU9IX60_9GAMM
MDGRETSRDIERTAAHWVARMDRAPLSAKDEARLQRWLAGDARRRGALLRAKALWLQAESLRGTGQLRELNAAPRAATVASPPQRRWDPHRRRLLQWSGAMAASLLLAVFLFVSVPVPTAYATTKGEMRRVSLADGSALTLNTDSKVEVYDDAGRLRVKVKRGEVFIEAAHVAPPLVVEVDGRRLNASAAVFVVRMLAGQPAQVTVQDGEVELAATSTTVAANTHLSLPDRHGKVQTASLSPDQLQSRLAWREGKISFQGETLAEAVADFARYSDTRIVIADPELARMPITGLFAANNPVGFGRAVAKVFDTDVREERNRVVVGRAD